MFTYGSLEKDQILIVEEKKLAYVVISKVACSSIKGSLVKFIGKSLKNIEDNYSIHHQKFNYRNFYSDIPDDYYLFAFVRNPFDRLVSAYKSKFIKDLEIPGVEFNYKNYLMGIFDKGESFESFVNKVCIIPDRAADRHFKSQYSNIYKNKSLQVDYVGKFEIISTDFEPLVHKFDTDPLPNLNMTSKSKSYQERYTSTSMIEKVAKRYSKDIEKFGYLDEYHNLLNSMKNET